jgi:hypothetical protein
MSYTESVQILVKVQSLGDLTELHKSLINPLKSIGFKMDPGKSENTPKDE